MVARFAKFIPICALLLVFCILLPEAAAADSPAAAVDIAPLERGRHVATAIATVTGTAISPLFGVCILGAYTYTTTPLPSRLALPFYCAPAFWIPLAILLILVMLKDTVGTAVPLLKKPLDAIEILIVNKAALLFAVLPVVWHEAAGVSNWHAGGAPLEFLATVHAASPAASSTAYTGAISMAFAVITGVAIAFTVWLTGHALDVLALLSPIPLLDIAFKGLRVAACLFVGVLAHINARVALLASFILIAICIICFWWAVRLAVFGAVFAWDILRWSLLGKRRNPSLDGEVLAFTAHPIGGLQKRSFGVLRLADDGCLEFAYRHVGIGFRSVIRLQNPATYQVGKGFVFPCLLTPAKTGRDYRFQFRLLPRYVGFEDEVRSLLKLGGVRDLRVPSEFRTAWNWLHGTVARARFT